MRKLWQKIPQYSVIPVTAMIILAVITYLVTKLFTDGGNHYDISLPIDFKIPFVPSFMIIYVGSYIQWFLGIVMIVKEGKDFCLRIISGEMIAKLICFVIFLVLPTTMARAEIVGNDIFSKIAEIIYTVDTPTNLFPSIHCLESWIIFRASCHFKRYGKWVAVVNGVFAILVFASVVLVKQHLILDIPSAIIIAEIGIFISKKFKTERLFLNIENTIKRREHV